MEYGLARIVLGSRAFVQLSENEYQAIKRAQEGLLESLFIEEKYDLVVENYLELEETLLESVVRHMILSGQDYRWFQVEHSLFNRRLVNLLTVVRTYDHQVKQHVNKIFRAEEEDTPDVSGYFSQQHDERIGYRAMEELRDFAQHRGFPVHAVTYGSKVIDADKKRKICVTVSPYLRPDELRADRKFNKKVLSELEGLGEKVDLKTLVRDYIEGIWVIHAKIREHLKSKIESWENVLNQAIMRFQSQFPEEPSIIGLAAVIRDDEGYYAAPIQIFEDFMEYRKHLERKNGALTNLAHRYVTSEVVDLTGRGDR